MSEMTTFKFYDSHYTLKDLNEHLRNYGYEVKPTFKDKEEKLMTREEAEKKLDKISINEYPSLNNVLMAKLEALGLIKFKEEKKRFKLYDRSVDKFIYSDSISDVFMYLQNGLVIVTDNG